MFYYLIKPNHRYLFILITLYRSLAEWIGSKCVMFFDRKWICQNRLWNGNQNELVIDRSCYLNVCFLEQNGSALSLSENNWLDTVEKWYYIHLCVRKTRSLYIYKNYFVVMLIYNRLNKEKILMLSRDPHMIEVTLNIICNLLCDTKLIKLVGAFKLASKHSSQRRTKIRMRIVYLC